MRIEPECLPCLAQLGHACLDRARLAPAQRQELEEELGRLLQGLDRDQPTPLAARQVQRLVSRAAGQDDLYEGDKRRSNRLALDQLPGLRARVAASPDPFRAAVKLAVAGNVIDYAVSHRFPLDQAISKALEAEPAVDEVDRLARGLEQARRVLYLADNAGEIMLDRLLLEQLPDHARVTLAVRGGPAINDVTRKDLAGVDLPPSVALIDSGVAVGGTWLELCGPELKSAFDQADLIISKGQGNFETLAGQRGVELYFLFVIKCAVVSRLTGVPEGEAGVARSETLQ